MYKLFAKTNEQNQIIDIKTNDTVIGIEEQEGWTEIGEYPDRFYNEPIKNERGSYLYELVDGEKVERDTSDDDTSTERSIKADAVDAKTRLLILSGYDTGSGIISTSETAQNNHREIAIRKARGIAFETVTLSTIDGGSITYEVEADYFAMADAMFNVIKTIRENGIAIREQILSGEITEDPR